LAWGPLAGIAALDWVRGPSISRGGRIEIPCNKQKPFRAHHLLRPAIFCKMNQCANIRQIWTDTKIHGPAQKKRAESPKRAAKELGNAYRRLHEQTALIVEKEEQLRRAEKLSTLGEFTAGCDTIARPRHSNLPWPKAGTALHPVRPGAIWFGLGQWGYP